MADKVIFLTAGTTSFTIPTDWTAVNKIEVIGGGAGGKTGAAAASGGGGGGQYRVATNTAGLSGSIQVSIGASVGAGTAGNNTWWNGASFGAATLSAQGGQTTASGTGGVGGSTGAGGSGSNGGAGGVGGATALTGGGGGGAAGPGGVGGLGGNGDNTAAGADFGGGGGSGAGTSTGGGTGGNGTTSAGAGGTNANGGGPGGAGGSGAGVTAAAGSGVWTSTHLDDATTPSVVTRSTGGGGGGGGSAAGAGGSATGAGGGGGGAGNGTGGSGGAGLIVITYTPAVPPPVFVGFPVTEWQAPVGSEQPLRNWTVSLQQSTLAPQVPPVSVGGLIPQVEWQLSQLQPLPGQTWAWNPLTLRVSVGLPPGDQWFARQIVPPFPISLRTWIDRNPLLPQTVTALPPGDQWFARQIVPPFPVSLRTWIDRNPILPQPSLPPGETSFELPRGLQQPLYGWVWNYNRNLIGQDQLPVGDRLTDRLPDLLRTGQTWIGPLPPPVVVAALPPGEQFFALPPQPYPLPGATWAFQYTLYVPIQYTGFASADWPPAPPYPDHAWLRTWIQNPLTLRTVVATPPFNQKDWPVPRASAQPDRFWAWSYNLNLIGKDAFPAGEQRTELSPIGALQPLRGWAISLLQTTLSVTVPAPIGEQFYDLPPLLPTFLMDMSNNSRLNINLFPPPPPPIVVTTILMGQACL